MDKFRSCLSFFTRLSLPGAYSKAPPAETLSWLPLVAIIIGLCGMIAAMLVSTTGASAEAQALVAIIVMALVTGALHEDGLADCFDGFGGGATKARKLEIMRDSRIGTYGVLAIVLVMALEFMLIAQISPMILIGLAVVSRASIPIAMAHGANARADGLGASTGTPSQRTVWINVGAAVVIGLIFGGFQALILAAVFGAAAYLFAKRQIGGLTGDVYGLLVKATGVGFLLGAIA